MIGALVCLNEPLDFQFVRAVGRVLIDRRTFAVPGTIGLMKTECSYKSRCK